MGKTQYKRTCESEKPQRHVTQNGKVEKDVERICRQKTKDNLAICFWCLKDVPLHRYSRHARFCKVRKCAYYKCYVCDGVKVTYRTHSSKDCVDSDEKDKVICNVCECVTWKRNWDQHSQKKCHVLYDNCTCDTVVQ